MNYIKQILYELKSQRMVTWVSISGTALAIFLIMAIFMSDRLRALSISPESNRDRILIGQNIDFDHEHGSGSTVGLSDDLANKLYGNLDGVEKISFVGFEWGTSDVGIPNEKTISAQTLGVDDRYWQVYEYEFISGKPFEKEEIEAGSRNVILTESIARKIFGEIDVAGRELNIDNVPFVVKGVVKDSNPLLTDGTVSVFKSYDKYYKNEWEGDITGKTNVRLLLKNGIEPEDIKSQVQKRYDDINRMWENTDNQFRYHQQPFTTEEMDSDFFGSNNDPDVKSKRRLRTITYIVLLILPAINLSSITRSRLRKRISEIGVRRAFGAKRRSIIRQIFTENLLVTFIGGIIGLCLSLIFLAFLSEFFLTLTVNVVPVIWDVFDFSTFFIAFGACFVLNILSATVPAWSASREEPALAISQSR